MREEALQQAIASSARSAELSALLLLAESYLREGKAMEARYHAAQARELSDYLGQCTAQVEALLAFGEAQAMLLHTDEAMKAFTDAACAAEKSGARLLALRTAIRQAELGANFAPELLLTQARAVDSPLLSWAAWQAAGILYENLGDLSRAREAYQQAIDGIMHLRGTLIDESLGDTYLEGTATWGPVPANWPTCCVVLGRQKNCTPLWSR